MDAHHDYQAAGGVQHHPPQPNVNGLQNGLNWTGFADGNVDQAHHGFDHGWTYSPAEHNTTSAPQSSLSVYPNWQSQPVNEHSLDPYGRQFSRSPAGQHNYSNWQNAQPQSTSVYDPALPTSTFPSNNETWYPDLSAYQPRQSAVSTIAPAALDAAAQRLATPQRSQVTQPPVDQKALISSIPRSRPDGFFNIIDFDHLAKSTGSVRLRSFVNIGAKDFEYPINKTVIPPAPVRRSRNDLRKLAALDPKLSTKLGTKVHKKSAGSVKVRKELKAYAPLAASPHIVSGSEKAEVLSSTDESSSEEDSSDYDTDDEPSLPNPLPAKRPDEDLKQGVRYDAIKALWRPKPRGLTTDEIKVGLKDYWEIVRTIRDRWKADGLAVKEAEEKKKLTELPFLKARVKDQRDLMEVALSAALEHGHREILELSSENLPFLFLCCQFLQDAKDEVNTKMVRVILGLLSLCITLTEEKMTKTQLAKMSARIAKKANPEISDLLKKVNEAVAVGTKKLAEEEKERSSASASEVVPKADAKVVPSSLVKAVPSNKVTTEQSAGVKRALPSGSTNGQPAKRVASTGPGEGKIDVSKLGSVKKITTSAGVNKPSGSAPVKTTKMTVTKPSSFFNSAQPVKKPGPVVKPATSVLASVAKAIEKKPAIAAIQSAPKPEASKSGFSFAGTMANLNKPKEKPPSPKPEVRDPDESPEQKQKRLRKESRRKLRVSFKPDSSLVEIRVFAHDPDEELGHDASMIRDAGDVDGEGRMFKQLSNRDDFDEEDEAGGEEELTPWTEPKGIDFSDVDAEERARNYAPFAGGQMTVESAEKRIRQDYEDSTLLVVYADRSDIPPSPREPSEDTDMPDAVVIKEFGTPTDVVLEKAKKQGSNASATSGGQSASPNSSTVPPNLASLLASLQTRQAQPQQQNQSQPMGLDFTSLLGQVRAQGTPQPIPTSLYQQHQQPTTPVMPVQQSTVSPDLARILAQVQASQQPQQAINTQGAPDLAAFMAAMARNPGSANANTSPFGNGFPPVPQNFPFPFAPAMAQQNQQPGHPIENEERRRWREQAEQEDEQQLAGNNGVGKKGKGKHFTQSCKYWSLGKCQKGDKCTYRHD